MTKICFNCQKNIEKPEEGKCPNCSIEFEPAFMWTEDMAEICDKATNHKRNSEFDKSIKIYQQLNIDYPNNPLIYRSWAKTLVASGNYDLALEYFIKAKNLAEFYGSIDPNCEEYIMSLTREQRDSEKFNYFLQRISGGSKYETNPNKINDHINIIK